MEHTAQHSLEWFSSEGFMPHGHCYLWTPELLWTIVISEAIIVLAYFSIPFGLMYFVSRRPDLKFNWMFKLFSLFIFACGTTHLLGIWTIWYPDYWLDAAAKAVTAVISLLAAVMMWPMIPRALKLPSTVQLEDAVTRLQQEVIQRQATEAELSHLKEVSDTRFHVLFDQAPLGVAEVDLASGKFLLINQKVCDLLGYSREEMLQRDYSAFAHPDDGPFSKEKILALQEGRLASHTIDKRFLHKDGRAVWMTLTVSSLKKSGDPRPTFLAMVQDITERKQAETELQRQLDELRRWNQLTLGRESRIAELKNEVNALLAANGQPPRYNSPPPVAEQT